MDPAALAQFAAITGSSDHIAAQYLGLTEGHTEQAIELYFANDGADLQTSSLDPQQSNADPGVPQPPHSSGPSRGYQDADGIVHIDDSDPDDQDFANDGNDADEPTTRRTRKLRQNARPTPSDSSHNRPDPLGRQGKAAIDDDEAMARRLQEEFYGAVGQNGGTINGSSEVLDEHGYRAPIGRTTETLIGPGSLDPTNAEEMRAAVLEQMMARRQQPRNRGKSAL